MGCAPPHMAFLCFVLRGAMSKRSLLYRFLCLLRCLPLLCFWPPHPLWTCQGRGPCFRPPKSCVTLSAAPWWSSRYNQASGTHVACISRRIFSDESSLVRSPMYMLEDGGSEVVIIIKK